MYMLTLSKRLLISRSAGVILVMTKLPKIEVIPGKTAWTIIMNADLRASRADIKFFVCCRRGLKENGKKNRDVKKKKKNKNKKPSKRKR